MIKAELVKCIADKTGVENTVVEQVVNTLMETVKNSIIAGEPVYLRGFRSFIIKEHA